MMKNRVILKRLLRKYLIYKAGIVVKRTSTIFRKPLKKTLINSTTCISNDLCDK